MSALTLVIGNKNYSSWSMRPWVLMRELGIEFEEILIPLRQADSLERKLDYSPAGKVPVLLDCETRVWDSLAIVEYLAEKFPEKQVWPAAAEARALARAVSAEMHSGFTYLRERLPLNCRAHRPEVDRGPGVEEDIDRIRELWSECRARFGGSGRFLFGEPCAADAMFAPVASRFRTYGVELDGAEARYAEALLGLPAVREWVAAAGEEPWSIAKFDEAGD